MTLVKAVFPKPIRDFFYSLQVTYRTNFGLVVLFLSIFYNISIGSYTLFSRSHLLSQNLANVFGFPLVTYLFFISANASLKNFRNYRAKSIHTVHGIGETEILLQVHEFVLIWANGKFG